MRRVSRLPTGIPRLALAVGLAWGLCLCVSGADPVAERVVRWGLRARDFPTGRHHRPPAGLPPPIYISARMVVDAAGKPPLYCPGADTLQLLRADDPSGPFEPIQERQARRDQDAAAVAPNPGHPPAITRKTYSFTLQDHDVIPMRPYYYRLRFLGPEGEVLAESGVCSGLLTVTPAVQLDAGDDGRLSVRWEGGLAAPNPDAFVQGPSYAIRAGPVHEFARSADPEGRVSLPLTATHARSHHGELWFVVEAVVRSLDWDSARGSFAVDVSSIHRVALERMGPRHLAAPPEKGAFYYLPAGFNEVGYKVECASSGFQDFSFTTSNRLGRLQRHGSRAYWPAGVSETHYATVSWREGESTRETSFRLVSLPLQPDLWAEAGSDSVELHWTKAVFEAADWLEGPFVQIWRLDDFDQVLEPGAVAWGDGRLIARVPVNDGRYIDDQVAVGETYHYALELTGLLRTEAWSAGIGVYSCAIPVLVRACSDRWRPPEIAAHHPAARAFPVMAVVEAPRPLRVGFLIDPETGPDTLRLAAPMIRALEQVEWLTMVERDQAAALMDERELAAWARRRDAGEPGEQAPTDPADILLHIRERSVGMRPSLDVWVNDFQNARRLRVLTAAVDEMDAAAAAQALTANLARLFPRRAACQLERSPEDTWNVRTLALASLVPLTPDTARAMPPAGLQDLLSAFWSQEHELALIDREHMRSLWAEWDLSAAIEPQTALALGNLVSADAVFTGFYSVEQGRINLSGRLADTASGAVIRWISAEAELAELDALAARLAEEIRKTPAVAERLFSPYALHRREASAHRSLQDTEESARLATYIASESSGHFQALARRQEDQGDPENALTTYTRGLAVARAAGEDRWTFVEGAARMLRLLDRNEDELQWWQATLSERDLDVSRRDQALLELADCCARLGRRDQALAALEQVSQDSLGAGRSYEGLGELEQAALRYRRALREADLNQRRFLPAQRALLLLTPHLEPSGQRQNWLTIAEASAHWRPYQARKALALCSELDREAGNAPSRDLEAWLEELAEQSRRAFVRDRMARYVDWPARLHFEAQVHLRMGDHALSIALLEACVERMKSGVPEGSPLLSEFESLLVRAQEGHSFILPMIFHRKNSPKRELGSWSFSVDLQGVLAAQPIAATEPAWRMQLNFRPAHLDSRGSSPTGLLMTQFIVENLSRMAHGVLHGLLDVNGLLILTLPWEGVIQALDRETGSVRWTFAHWDVIANPILRGDHELVVADRWGEVLVIDLADGTVVQHIMPAGEKSATRADVKRGAVARHDHGSYYLWPGGLALNENGREATLSTHPGRYDLSAGVHLTNAPSKPPALPPVQFDLQDLLFSEIVAERQDGVRRCAQQLDLPEGLVPQLLHLASDDALGAHFNGEALRLALASGGTALLSHAYTHLTHAHNNVRLTALRAIAEHRGRVEPAQLRPLVLTWQRSGTEHELIQEAIRQLIRCQGLDEARRLLRAWIAELPTLYELSDPQGPTPPIYRQYCAAHRNDILMALLKAGDRSVVDEIKQGSHWRAPDPNNPTFVALCRAGDEDALRLLEEHARQNVALIRDQLPDPRFFPLLERLYEEGVASVELIGAFQRLGDPRAIPYLLALAQDGLTSRFQAPIIRALEDLSGQAFGDQWTRWEIWWRNEHPERRPL